MVTSRVSYTMHCDLGHHQDHYQISTLQDFSRLRLSSPEEPPDVPVIYVAMATWIPKCNMSPENSLEDHEGNPEDNTIQKTNVLEKNEIEEKDANDLESKNDQTKLLNSTDTQQANRKNCDNIENEDGQENDIDYERNNKKHIKLEGDLGSESNKNSCEDSNSSPEKEVSQTIDLDEGENDNELVESVEDGEDKQESDPKFSISEVDLVQLTAKVKESILKTNVGRSLTPQKLQKKIEIELKKEQKRIEREEKEKRKQELREEKMRQKQEKEEQRKRELEVKQKEKELKEEKKKREREEKEKKKKEKEEMEEQKRKEREQEKLKKQQEIEEKNREKQRMEEQKQKSAAVFASFFTKKAEVPVVDDKKSEESFSSHFKPFEVKAEMRLAPIIRMEISEEKKENVLRHLELQNEEKLYLQELKNGKPIGKSSKTWPQEDNDTNDDVVIIEGAALGESIVENPKSAKMKVKFLKFEENRRPPYYGTWRKKSKSINPRRPFSQDKELLDYEVDSDDDWEDEEDAGEVESLKGSDEEEKETSDNEYEVDNEFFVPHGHLSDDELNDEEDKALSPETHKAQLKLLKNEFEEEMKSKTQKIKPRIIGCVWQNKKGGIEEAIEKFLEPMSVICIGRIKITKRCDIVNQTPVRKMSGPKKRLNREHVPMFLKIIHGNVKKGKVIVNEFLEYLKSKGIEANVSKISLNKELKQLAEWTKCPEEGSMLNKFCWFVPEKIRNEYNVELTLPNKWKYMANLSSE